MTNTSLAAAAIVGSNLRAELARANRSQAWLAERLNIGQSQVSQRLSGKVPIDVNELAQIAALLNVPLADLLRGVEAPTAVPA